MLAEAALADLKAHAARAYPREACGLLVANGHKAVYVPCENVATEPELRFRIQPRAYLDAERHGPIIAVCHSHPNGRAQPSEADRAACEACKLPWYIFAYPADELVRIEPCGYRVPLVGREFVHGVLDCYALVRDFYAQELKIELPDYERPDDWWEHGQDLYLDNFQKAGFRRVDTLQKYDGILMQIRSPTANHAAVYLGDDIILQHLAGTLSHRTVYGGYWAKNTMMFVRHAAFL
jgi:proteasome lid subunit RPN8/RPN11